MAGSGRRRSRSARAPCRARCWRFRRCWAVGRGRALDIGPVEIALKAENERAELHIVADRAADQRALDVEAAGRVQGDGVGPFRAAEAVAGVDADIKAVPGEERHIGRRARRRQAIATAACRRRAPKSPRQPASSDNRKQQSFHDEAPVRLRVGRSYAERFAEPARAVDYVSRRRRAPKIFNRRSGIGEGRHVGGVAADLWTAVENQTPLAFCRELMIRTKQ